MTTQAVRNGGFEGSFNYWDTLVNGVVLDDTTKNSGNYSAKFPANSEAVIYQLFVEAVNQDYIDNFTIYVKQPNGYPAYSQPIYILYEGWSADDPDNPSYITVISIYPPVDWSSGAVNLAYHLESGKGDVIGILLKSAGVVNIWFDDASLEYTTPPPPPSIEVETLPETSRTSSTVVLWGEASGTSGVHLSLLGFDYRLIGEEDWQSIYLSVDLEVPWQWSVQIGNLDSYRGYEYRAKAYCDDEANYPELVGWYYGDTRSFDTIEAESDVGIVIIRPKSIVIGPYSNGTSTYEWYGIRSIKWSDVTPWVHTDIPTGPMLHQHLRSPHVTGEIVVIDLDKIHTALFVTVIDNASHMAIDINNNNKKYPVTYCIFRFVDQNKDIIEYSVSKFRVETVGVDLIELGHETRYIVRFSADLIKKEA